MALDLPLDQHTINLVYREHLGRDADTPGLNYHIANNTSLSELQSAIKNSSEYIHQEVVFQHLGLYNQEITTDVVNSMGTTKEPSVSRSVWHKIDYGNGQNAWDAIKQFITVNPQTGAETWSDRMHNEIINNPARANGWAIRQYYLKHLGRIPSQTEIEDWQGTLDTATNIEANIALHSGGSTTDIAGNVTVTEGTGGEYPVANGIYKDVFGTDANLGTEKWANFQNNNVTTTNLKTAIRGTKEWYDAFRGYNSDDNQTVITSNRSSLSLSAPERDWANDNNIPDNIYMESTNPGYQNLTGNEVMYYHKLNPVYKSTLGRSLNLESTNDINGLKNWLVGHPNINYLGLETDNADMLALKTNIRNSSEWTSKADNNTLPINTENFTAALDKNYILQGEISDDVVTEFTTDDVAALTTNDFMAYHLKDYGVDTEAEVSYLRSELTDVYLNEGGTQYRHWGLNVKKDMINGGIDASDTSSLANIAKAAIKNSVDWAFYRTDPVYVQQWKDTVGTTVTFDGVTKEFTQGYGWDNEVGISSIEEILILNNELGPTGLADIKAAGKATWTATDTVVGGDGNDTVDGGDGNDTVTTTGDEDWRNQFQPETENWHLKPWEGKYETSPNRTIPSSSKYVGDPKTFETATDLESVDDWNLVTTRIEQYKTDEGYIVGGKNESGGWDETEWYPRKADDFKIAITEGTTPVSVEQPYNIPKAATPDTRPAAIPTLQRRASTNGELK